MLRARAGGGGEMQVQGLIDVLESLAPPALAESWDNAGLLLGERGAQVDRVVACLTLTPDVAAEAVRVGAQFVVSHHPVLFKAVQRLTADTAEGRTLLALLRAGVAVYSPHTAWDNAPQGINQQLAELLELQDIRPLRPQAAAAQVKLVTFVPAAQLPAVQRAVWDAGAGVIGAYRDCSYVLHGTGTFFGGDEANPAVGQAGRLESVEEARLEVVCPAARVAAALAALRSAHPYEEPAIDVFPLQPLPTGGGAGRCGRLPRSLSLREFSQLVGARLRAQPAAAGDPETRIECVGVACGAAAEFWKDARRAGCQALLTGEARFHDAIAVRDAGFAMVLAGHYATERPGMERLAELLAERCPGVTVTASAVECDPLGG